MNSKDGGGGAAARAPEPADIETASDGYAARFAGPAGAWMLERQRAIVLAMLKDRPGATVLDVGGGHAQLALPLAAAGYKVTVQGSAPSCANRVRAEIETGRVAFVCSPLLALPFPDRAFDVVVSIRLLPHCPEWPRLIAELCRVARRAVIVDYPAWRSVNVVSGALFGLKKKVEGNTRPFRLFTHGEVRRAFAQHGFSKHWKKGQFVFPMVVHRKLAAPAVSQALEGAAGALGLGWLAGSPVLLKAVRDER